MTNRARFEKVDSYRLVGAFRAFFLPPECSFWLPGVLDAEVNGARDDSWRSRFAVRLYLVAKPSHVGGQCGWASLSSALTYSP
jgi:hypothetical protein